jgi:hypothetical protein
MNVRVFNEYLTRIFIGITEVIRICDRSPTGLSLLDGPALVESSWKNHCLRLADW